MRVGQQLTPCRGAAGHYGSRAVSAETRDGKHYRHWMTGAAVVLVLGGVLASWMLSDRTEEKTVRDMDPADRSALHEATLRNVDLLCARADTETVLRDRCSDAAAFLLAFPECDEACRDHARSLTRKPAR